MIFLVLGFIFALYRKKHFFIFFDLEIVYMVLNTMCTVQITFDIIFTYRKNL